MAVEQEQLLFYSIGPVNAPEDKRLAVAEFLTRANYGKIIGNFELDMDLGEIRYKTSADIMSDSLSETLFKRLIYANVAMMDEYLQKRDPRQTSAIAARYAKVFKNFQELFRRRISPNIY